MDLWEKDYKKALKVGNEIKGILENKKNNKQAKYRAILRGKITEFQQSVNFLKNQLNSEYIKKDKYYIQNEHKYRKRLNLLETMKNELSMLYDNYAATSQEDVDSYHMEGLNEYYDEENEIGLNELGKEELLLKEERLKKLQDEQLDFLEGTAQNLKNISYTINSEINIHNELLDNIDRDFDETNILLNRNANLVTRITRSASNFFLYVIIGLLTTSLILFIIIL